jgi:hypothetical protein
MQHLQSTPSCKDIVEEAYLWEKQKLNTQSSTESEIVGANDFMPGICLTLYFMEVQGYQVQDNVLFQDNKSTILLEKNGKASSSKHMKHVNIQYFFITMTSWMYHWSDVQPETRLETS